MQFLEFAKKRFKKVIVAVSTQIYQSYFYDDHRLAEFYAVEIRPLSHHQQELLVRKVLSLSKGESSLPDGLVDHVENRVNAVVISNRIVPRYPFYVLSILQSEERFMPDIPLTSFGHCYYVLIVAHLVKSGVSRKDEDINASFNFLENLAHWIFSSAGIHGDGQGELDEFILSYRETYYAADSLINRLRHPEYGILTEKGEFRRSYMYYYFLGRYFANAKDTERDAIEQLCKNSHIGDNHLIVLFLIHHTTDDRVIDEVLVDCLDILADVGEATLEETQTRVFADIVATMPESILSRDSVESEREHQRKLRDLGERQEASNHKQLPKDMHERFRQLYKMHRSIEILGQVLKNKYGVLPKVKVEDLVETIVDGGLRLVNVPLTDEKKMSEGVAYLRERYPEMEEQHIRKLLSGLLFFWTLGNLEIVARAVSVPAILEAVNVVVARNGTPAYELVGFLSSMQCAEKLTAAHVNQVKKLKKGSQDRFFDSAVSLMAQSYMNTHASAASVEQAMCAALGIRYVYRRREDE